MHDRYARNDLKNWLERHGSKKDDASSVAGSVPASPRLTPNKKKKGKVSDEDGAAQGFAVDTGTT